MEAHSSNGDLALEKPKILEGIVLSRNAQRFILGKIDPGGEKKNNFVVQKDTVFRGNYP